MTLVCLSNTDDVYQQAEQSDNMSLAVKVTRHGYPLTYATPKSVVLSCGAAVSPSSIPQATSKVKYNFVINAGGESYGTADAIVVDVLDGSTSTTDTWTLDCPSITENQRSGSAVLTATFSTTAACSFTVTVETTHQANGAVPAYKVAVTFKQPANANPGLVISSTQFAALKVYTGNTLTVIAPTIASADDVAEKYVQGMYSGCVQHLSA